MKKNRSNILAVGVLALTLVLGFGVGRTRLATAAQMGDMPYDLHYIDMMIMHHQEGIEMAQMAQTKAVSPKVKALADRIVTDQQKDIAELQGHRNHWYAGKPPMDPAMMSSMMQSMHPGMMSMEDTRRKLLAADGAAFDRLFLETMIHHHQMAIDMSKEARTKAEHAEIKEIARKTIVKQTAEISEMNRLKGGGKAKAKTKAKPKAKAKPMDHTHMH